MSNRNFYPGDCRRQVEEFLAGFEPPEEPAELVAGIVPHAGWIYSGRVAARVWKALAERARPESVIIFGTVHHPMVAANSVDPEGSWETPLGDVMVDAALASEILREMPGLLRADPSAHDGEHSIEVQLPMVKAILPEAKIIPIAVPPSGDPVHLGDLLAHLTKGRPVVAVGSTDLTHYGEEHFGFAPRGTGPAAQDWMRSNDERVVRLAETLLAEEIAPEVAAHHNACGPGPMAAATAFARARGAERGIVLDLTTSHDVLPRGEFTSAVGYAGVVF